MRYRTILIDPPWPQGKTGRRSVRPRQGQELDYPTMSLVEIQALPVAGSAAEDSLCFLWTTDRFLEEAHHILRGWGFRKHCTFVWVKSTGVCPFSVQFRAEFLLMGYAGRLRLARIGLPTTFAGKSHYHSQKPEEAYHLIETIAYPPRLELFARAAREGWCSLGNEIDGQDIRLALSNHIATDLQIVR